MSHKFIYQYFNTQIKNFISFVKKQFSSPYSSNILPLYENPEKKLLPLYCKNVFLKNTMRQ